MSIKRYKLPAKWLFDSSCKLEESPEGDIVHYEDYEKKCKELEELQIALMKILCVSIIQIGDDPEESEEQREINHRKRTMEALNNDPIIQKHIQIGFDIYRNILLEEEKQHEQT